MSRRKSVSKRERATFALRMAIANIYSAKEFTNTPFERAHWFQAFEWLALRAELAS